MADTLYTYDLTDFTGLTYPTPNLSALQYQIEASSITIALSKIVHSAGPYDIWFKAGLSETEITTLGGVVAAHTGKPLADATPAIGEFGEMLVSNRPLPSTLDFYETNKHMTTLTDPCTWYDSSEAVVEEAMVDDDPTNHKIWKTSTATIWIDLSHHRVMNEELISDVAQYQVKIEVNDGGGWDVFTQRHNIWDPTAAGGEGDYDYSLLGADEYFVNFNEGKIIFGASQEGYSVRASYYKSTTFLYVLRPAAGKVLEVRDAEVQGSIDLIYTCVIAFQLWGFNPALGFDPNEDKVPWQSPLILGTQWNFLSEGKGNYPAAIAIGGNYHYGQVKRGMTNNGIIMPFPYNTSKILKSSLGMELRMFFLEGDGPWEGEFGNATFYCYEYTDADWIEP